MVEVEPALEPEAFFETIYVLARDGKLGANASLTPPDRGLARWTPSWGDVRCQAACAGSEGLCGDRRARRAASRLSRSIPRVQPKLMSFPPD